MPENHATPPPREAAPEPCPAATSRMAAPGKTVSERDDTADAVARARALFPRGLAQPEGSFRFSLDALLLAAFAHSVSSAANGRPRPESEPSADAPPPSAGRRTRTFVDLGTGCGVVGLALLLAQPRMHGTGVELDAALAQAARHNATLLGLESRFHVVQADLADPDAAHLNGEPGPNVLPPDMSRPGTLRPGSADLVVANPPYRRPGSGRLSATTRRTAALFETQGTLAAFARAAGTLLRTRGKSCWIYATERLADLLAELRAAGQEPKRLRFVHSRACAPATLVLVEAVRGAKPGLSVEPPLVLYAGHGPDTALTDEGLAFCPLLACNAGPRGRQGPGGS